MRILRQIGTKNRHYDVIQTRYLPQMTQRETQINQISWELNHNKPLTQINAL